MVWDILADVDAWPQTFTPYLKEARLEGEERARVELMTETNCHHYGTAIARCTPS